ncbi:uridine/cytidine kinase [Erysipelotrichaceae bacterium]|nr:uridine/cytidine kinase [Erysipelotrichaceae bacterium]
MIVQKSPLIIGIAGGSGSGKTTVSANIARSIPDREILTIIRHDDYYKDQSHLTMEQRLETNYDHPFSIDNDLLIADLKKLKANQAIQKPIYDFIQYTRSSKSEVVEPSSIIILEGILTLEDKRLRDLMDMKLFIHTPADIRFIRRLRRDVELRGRSLDAVINHYLETVSVMHDQFIEPSKRYADIIIPTGGDNSVAIDLLTAKIYSAHKTRNSV